MENANTNIELLKKEVVAVFGRTLDSPSDYDALSASIQAKTMENISTSTLKRLFGYIKPATDPRPSTLSALSRYVGYTGWSDFVNKKRSSKTPISKRGITYLIAILACCLAIGISYFLNRPEPSGRSSKTTKQDSINHHREKIIATPVLVKKPESKTMATTNDKTAAQEKYEQILTLCTKMTIEKCNVIRARRSQMDVLTYKELIDSMYYPFVFTEMKKIIDKEVSHAFPKDTISSALYRNNIFAQCREICVELYREIPNDELTKAYQTREAQ